MRTEESGKSMQPPKRPDPIMITERGIPKRPKPKVTLVDRFGLSDADSIVEVAMRFLALAYALTGAVGFYVIVRWVIMQLGAV